MRKERCSSCHREDSIELRDNERVSCLVCGFDPGECTATECKTNVTCAECGAKFMVCSYDR